MCDDSRHLNIKIMGRVQGVAFRYAARSTALALGVKGFVKNLPDGSVYLEAEGDTVQLNRLVAWCQEGHTRARVDKLYISEGNLKGFIDFEVRF